MAFYSLNEEILDTESDFNRNGVEVVEGSVKYYQSMKLCRCHF